MCFTCAPITLTVDSVQITYRRQSDPYSEAVDKTSAYSGHMTVALTAEVAAAGSVLARSTLYGIPEGPDQSGCAFENAHALAWVGADALERARPSMEGLAKRVLH